MPASSKPRKKYHQKAVIRPLNARNRWITEGAAHAVLVAMEAGQFEQDKLVDLVVHADVAARIARGRGLLAEARHGDALIRVAQAIQARNLDSGQVRVTPLEEVAIRASIKATLRVMQNASNAEILGAAETALRRM